MWKCGKAAALWLTAVALTLPGCKSGGGTVRLPEDSDAPSITVSGVSHGLSVHGSVGIGAEATDSGGVASVTLYIDNHVILKTSGSRLDYDWNSLSRADGWVAVAFKAVDNAGNRGFSAMAVWVGNANVVPDSPPPVVEPPVIVDPEPPAPDPDPAPLPDPEPVPDPDPAPIVGSGTADDPVVIAPGDTRDPGLPYVLFLGLSIGGEVWGLWHGDVLTSDDKGVQSIRLYANNKLLQSSDAGAMSVILDTLQFPDGMLSLNFILFDGDKHYSCEMIVFVTNGVDHTAPTLEMAGLPQDYPHHRSIYIGGVHQIRIHARDQSGIKYVRIKLEGVLLDEISGGKEGDLECNIDTLHVPDYDPAEPVGHHQLELQIENADTIGFSEVQTYGLVLKNMTEVSGTLRNRSSSAVQGAHVWIEAPPPGDSSGNKQIYEWTTDINGRFDFYAPIGNWTMHVDRGAVSKQFPVVLKPDGSHNAWSNQHNLYLPSGNNLLQHTFRVGVVTSGEDDLPGIAEDFCSEYYTREFNNRDGYLLKEDLLIIDGNNSLPGSDAPDLAQILDDPAKLYAIKALCIGSGITGETAILNDPAKLTRLRNWVNDGGQLFCSGKAYDFAEQCFPDLILFAGPTAGPGQPQPLNAAQLGLPASSLSGVVSLLNPEFGSYFYDEGDQQVFLDLPNSWTKMESLAPGWLIAVLRAGKPVAASMPQGWGEVTVIGPNCDCTRTVDGYSQREFFGRLLQYGI